jgi:hypothetical protein
MARDHKKDLKNLLDCYNNACRKHAPLLFLNHNIGWHVFDNPQKGITVRLCYNMKFHRDFSGSIRRESKDLRQAFKKGEEDLELELGHERGLEWFKVDEEYQTYNYSSDYAVKDNELPAKLREERENLKALREGGKKQEFYEKLVPHQKRLLRCFGIPVDAPDNRYGKNENSPVIVSLNYEGWLLE